MASFLKADLKGAWGRPAPFFSTLPRICVAVYECRCRVSIFYALILEAARGRMLWSRSPFLFVVSSAFA